MKIGYYLCVVGVFATFAPSSSAWAQQTPPRVCQEEPEYRQFDFWVGEWDVVANDSARTPAGSNTIQALHFGCVLQESWLSIQGGTGSSMNYYDPTTEKWRQLWVAASYLIDIEGGLNSDGAMVLEGEIRNFVSGATSPFRGTWTPMDGGVVRQFFEMKPAGSDDWSPWFDGLYLPKSG